MGGNDIWVILISALRLDGGVEARVEVVLMEKVEHCEVV